MRLNIKKIFREEELCAWERERRFKRGRRDDVKKWDYFQCVSVSVLLCLVSVYEKKREATPRRLKKSCVNKTKKCFRSSQFVSLFLKKNSCPLKRLSLNCNTPLSRKERAGEKSIGPQTHLPVSLLVCLWVVAWFPPPPFSLSEGRVLFGKVEMVGGGLRSVVAFAILHGGIMGSGMYVQSNSAMWQTCSTYQVQLFVVMYCKNVKFLRADHRHRISTVVHY